MAKARSVGDWLTGQKPATKKPPPPPKKQKRPPPGIAKAMASGQLKVTGSISFGQESDAEARKRAENRKKNKIARRARRANRGR